MQTNAEKLILKRQYNAPKKMVFEAFASAEALAKWWGPVEMPIEVISLDFKPKGKFHYKMVGSGHSNYGVFNYHQIKPFDLICWVNSFSNEKGEICKPPFDFDFPLEIYNELVFDEKDGITTLTLTGHPINATENQEKVFKSFHENMEKGFTGTFNQLENYLSSLK